MKPAARIATLALSVLSLAACDSDDEVVQTPDAPQSLAINVDASVMSGGFQLSGGNFPGSIYQRGVLAMHDPAINGLTFLGETWEGGYDNLMIVNGTYDAVYGHIDGELVPQNDFSLALAGRNIDMDQVVDVDVAMSVVVPTFTIDGNAFPTSVYSSAEFFLKPAGSTQLISLGRTNIQPAESVMVVPGVYDVIYSIREGDQLPQNENATVMAQVQIVNSPEVLNVDITSASFDGSWRLSVDGVLDDFPGSVYQRGEMSLRTEEGDNVLLGPTHSATAPVNVIAGTYDVQYAHREGDQVPQNAGSLVETGLTIPAGRMVHEGVVTAWSTNVLLRLNGGAFPASAYQSAAISLRDLSTNTETPLGRTHLEPQDPLLVDGTYDAVYSAVDGQAIPQNKDTVVGLGLTVDQAGAVLGINVQSVTVSGDFRLDGSPFPASAYESGAVELLKDGRGVPIPLGTTNVAPAPVVILSGIYDVVYRRLNGEQVPQNTFHLAFNDENLAADGVLLVDLQTTTVQPVFTLNNQPFPGSVYERGDFYLRGNHLDDQIYLGSSHADAPELVVVNGSYDVRYQHVQGSTIPQNLDAHVTSVQVQ